MSSSSPPYVYPFPSDHEVVDGDTLRIDYLDLGFYHCHKSMLCRLSDLDCPEKSTLAGKKVKAIVEDLITVSDLKRSTIQSLEKPDKYHNRFLARVMLCLPKSMREQFNPSIQDTFCLSQLLIYLGLGLFYSGKEKYAWTPLLLDAVCNNADLYLHRANTAKLPEGLIPLRTMMSSEDFT